MILLEIMHQLES